MLHFETERLTLTTKFDMETNVNNTTEPQHDAKLPVSGSVFVLQHKKTMRIHGCFATKEDAEKYANNSQNIAIMKLDIA